MATRLQYLPRRGSLPHWSFRSWPLSAVRGNPVVRRDDQCAAALQHLFERLGGAQVELVRRLIQYQFGRFRAIQRAREGCPRARAAA